MECYCWLVAYWYALGSANFSSRHAQGPSGFFEIPLAMALLQARRGLVNGFLDNGLLV